MTLQLYVFPPSPRAFKVMALANHLELDHELVMVNLQNGGQQAPEYAALNPNRKMPTLKDGDFVALGVERDSPVSGVLASGRRAAAGRRARTYRRDALAAAEGPFNRAAQVLNGQLGASPGSPARHSPWPISRSARR